MDLTEIPALLIKISLIGNLQLILSAIELIIYDNLVIKNGN